jgi:hypothetical protein
LTNVLTKKISTQSVIPCRRKEGENFIFLVKNWFSVKHKKVAFLA